MTLEEMIALLEPSCTKPGCTIHAHQKVLLSREQAMEIREELARLKGLEK